MLCFHRGYNGAVAAFLSNKKLENMTLKFDCLQMHRNFNIPSKMLFDFEFERCGGFGFAVREKYLARAVGKAAQPAEDLAVIGVGREHVEIIDFGTDRI